MRLCSSFSFRLFFATFVFFTAGLFVSHHAEAQSRTWIGGSGTWNTPASWSGGTLPDATHDAVQLAGAIDLPAGTTGTAANFLQGRDNFTTGVLTISGGLTTSGVTLAGGGNTVTTGTINSGTWRNSGTMVIGKSGSSSIVINNGVLNTGTQTFSFPYQYGSTVLGDLGSGSITVNSGTFINTGTLWMGGFNTGSLVQNSGSISVAQNTYLGYNSGTLGSPSGIGTLAIAGGTANFNAPVYIGYSGTGTVTVAGGTPYMNAADAGYNAGSNGTLTITSGSLKAGSATYIGISGTGKLSLTGSGGYFYNPWLDVGHSGTTTGTTAGTGSVYISSGTLENYYEMSVGWGGKGNFQMDGGTVITHTSISGTLEQTYSGTFYTNVGFRLGSSGSATITSGSWINYSMLNIGYSGTGVVSMSGGYVSSGSNLNIGFTEASSGRMLVTGGTLAVKQQLLVGNGIAGAIAPTQTLTYTGTGAVGVLTIDGGLVTTNNGGIIGNTEVDAISGTFSPTWTASSGTLTVTSGSWIDSGGNLAVGYDGPGTLNISNTGVVTVGGGTGSVFMGGTNLVSSVINLGTGGAGIGTLNTAALIGGTATTSFGSGTNPIGAYLNFKHTGTVSFAPDLSGSINVGRSGAGTTVLAGNISYTGSTTASSGTLQFWNGESRNVTFPGNVVTGSGNSAIIYDSAGTVTLNGTLSGTNGQLQQIGSGTLLVVGGMSYNGTLNIAAGSTLQIGNGGATTVNSALKIINNGVLILNTSKGILMSISGTGKIRQMGSGQTVLNPGPDYGGSVSIESGTFSTSRGIAGDILNNGIFIVNTTQISSVISGTGEVRKSNGTTTLSGSNTYTGSTTLTGGNLVVTGSLASSTTVSGSGILSGTGTTGNVTLNSSGTLGGSLTSGTVTINNGGVIAPTGVNGGPGKLTTTDETWLGGGKYVMNINDFTGTAGGDPGWSTIAITGGLTISADSNTPFVLKLNTLTLANAAGSAADFSDGTAYHLTLLTTTTGITGFDPSFFTIDTSGVVNAYTGKFSISQNGNNLQFDYTPNAYYPWVAGFNLSGTDAAAAYDYDHDGMPNLMEYALGTDPTVADSAAAAPVVGTISLSGQTYLTITYLRPIGGGQHDVTYTVQGATNLSNPSNWNTNNITQVSVTPGSGNLETVVTRSAIPIGSTGAPVFLRLSVSIP